jgi:hypothetical protein
MVVSKKFGFHYNNTGHGCYMISSNGGSWSHIEPSLNNTVKTFKFGKGDTVRVTVKLAEDLVTFTKDTQTYSLKFKKNEADVLHPCCIFYYTNNKLEVNKIK